MNDPYSRWVRYEPEKNIHRYYHLHIQPTLFGEWDVVRQWGRVAQRGGQHRIDHYSSYEEAKDRYETLCRLRAARHYSLQADRILV